MAVLIRFIINGSKVLIGIDLFDKLKRAITGFRLVPSTVDETSSHNAFDHPLYLGFIYQVRRGRLRPPVEWSPQQHDSKILNLLLRYCL